MKEFLRAHEWWKRLRNPPYRRRVREVERLRRSPRNLQMTTGLLGKPLQITDPASFLTMYEEIFENEYYRFSSPSPCPRILDAGANIGLACIYWKKLYPDARITAFEPDPGLLLVLEENLQSFDLTDVEVVAAALSDEKGSGRFDPRGGAAGRLSDSKTAGQVEVQQVLLSSRLNEPIDLLKLDIEGKEIDVLQECRGQLNRVERLFVEYHRFKDQPTRLRELLDILETAGFDAFIQSNCIVSQPFVKRPDWDGIEMALNIFAERKNL
ncbi:MAG: FkbM family methyltransferase [Methylacidiphilales bacterium]|nr:FkbM family methyltransferase [Candidatus Methylacidiphilales bacterium]